MFHIAHSSRQHTVTRRSFLATAAGVGGAVMVAGVGAARQATCSDQASEVIQRSATELLGIIRNKQMSCEEIVRAHLVRMDAVHDRISAVVFRADERALKRAKDADKALAIGRTWGCLHGLPVTIKDTRKADTLPRSIRRRCAASQSWCVRRSEENTRDSPVRKREPVEWRRRGRGRACVASARTWSARHGKECRFHRRSVGCAGPYANSRRRPKRP